MSDSIVRIEYGAVPNARASGGWLPVLWVNGKQRGDTYAARGYAKSEARLRAHSDAMEHARKYVGDWAVSVGERP